MNFEQYFIIALNNTDEQHGCDNMRTVYDYTKWILTSSEAAATARSLQFADMPLTVAASALEILDQMKCTLKYVTHLFVFRGQMLVYLFLESESHNYIAKLMMLSGRSTLPLALCLCTHKHTHTHTLSLSLSLARTHRCGRDIHGVNEQQDE